MRGDTHLVCKSTPIATFGQAQCSSWGVTSGDGVEPDDIATRVDDGTQLVAFSAVQTASGHRSDIATIATFAQAVGAISFVDGSQMVGALPLAADLPHIDVLATSDHKFLLNAGRGMGYCYLSPSVQDHFTPRPSTSSDSRPTCSHRQIRRPPPTVFVHQGRVHGFGVIGRNIDS